jgi:SAM-dependent methyltransferase
MASVVKGGFAPLQMKCPACGLELGDFPRLEDASMKCPHCLYSIFWDGACWDACADRKYRRDFARQWVLWEQGKLGDRNLVYGNNPKEYFRAFLEHASLTEAELASKKILEVGFGHGRHLALVQQYCPTAYGLDLSRPLASAKLRPGSAFFGNLFQIPFAAHQFDLVICRGVIHCTPDPKKAFACLAEQVAEDGLLYMGGLYEPGKGNLMLRKIFPGLWNYPEWARLGLASASSVLRAAIECKRTRNFSFSAFKRHYKHYKLDMFDVICPRWTSVHEEAEVIGWYKAQGFVARKVGYGDYFGVKSQTQ